MRYFIAYYVRFLTPIGLAVLLYTLSEHPESWRLVASLGIVIIFATQLIMSKVGLGRRFIARVMIMSMGWIAAIHFMYIDDAARSHWYAMIVFGLLFIFYLINVFTYEFHPTAYHPAAIEGTGAYIHYVSFYIFSLGIYFYQNYYQLREIVMYVIFGYSAFLLEQALRQRLTWYQNVAVIVFGGLLFGEVVPVITVFSVSVYAKAFTLFAVYIYFMVLFRRVITEKLTKQFFLQSTLVTGVTLWYILYFARWF
jgi:hypothetical protein